MNSSLDWAKLYAEGRCKDIGIPFDDEERHALHTLKIPVEYVRLGIITKEAHVKQLKEEAETGKKPLEKMSEEELIEIAKRFQVKLTPQIPKSVLIAEIRNRKKIKESQIKQQGLVEKAKKAVEDEIANRKVAEDKAKEANKTKDK